MYHTAKKIGISDTQIYKMAGNAVNVECVKHIAGNITECYKEALDCDKTQIP